MGTTRAVLPLSISASTSTTSLDDRTLIRGLPIQQSSDGNISFMHKSLQEYFTAQLWIESLLSLSSSFSSKAVELLGARLATDERGIINFLCHKIHDGTSSSQLLQQSLLAVVRLSRDHKDPQSTTASANAITILNASHFCFSKMDLSRISVPGADLSNMIADSTDFCDSDMTNVTFDQAWLKGTNFQRTLLFNVHFGVYPWIDVGCTVVSLTMHGEHLMSGDEGGRLKVWDLSTGQQVGQLMKCKSQVDKLITTNKYAITGHAGIIEIWNLTTYQRIKELTGNGSVIVHNGMIISGNNSGEIRLWDLETFEEQGEMRAQSIVECLTAYGGTLISGSKDGTIQVWDLNSLKQHGEAITNTANVVALAVVGNTIISGGRDFVVKLWDLETRRQLKLIPNMMLYNGSALAIHNETILICNAGAGMMQLWDLSFQQQVTQPLQFNTSVVCFTIAGDHILSGGLEGVIQTWEFPKPSTAINEPSIVVYSIAASDQAVICGSTDGYVEICDMTILKTLRRWKIHEVAISCLFQVDGKLITGSHDKKIKIHDVMTGELLTEPVDVKSEVNCAEIVGTNLIIGCDDSLQVWDISTTPFSLVHNFPVELGVARMTITKNKVVCGSIACLKIWDTVTWEECKSISGYAGLVKCLKAVDEVVIILSEKSLEAWSLETCKRLGNFKEHKHSYFVTVFEKMVISHGMEKTVILWDLTTFSQLHCISVPFLAVSVTIQNNFFYFGTSNQVVCMEYDPKKHDLVLKGGSRNVWSLNLNGCNVEGAAGLTPSQIALFRQTLHQRK